MISGSFSNVTSHDYRSNTIPQLTVVICSFQQESFIRDSLDRVQELHLTSQIDLIFIDDGSSDSSYAEALSWQSAMNFPGLIISKENEGLVSSLNLALSLARTPYIFFISADDLLCPGGINNMIHKLISNPGLSFSMGNCVCFGEGIKPRLAYDRLHKKYLQSPSAKRSGYLPSELPGSLFIQTVVFRTDFLRTLNGWDPRIRLDDLPLFVKLFSLRPEPKKDFIYDHDLVVSEYRQHANNMHKRLIHQFEIYEEFIRLGIHPKDHPDQLAYAISTYLTHSILIRNRNALLTIWRFAAKKRLLTLAIFWTFRLIIYKIFRKITCPPGKFPDGLS